MTRPIQHETLGMDLTKLSELLHKYGHQGQGKVVDEILVSLETPKPDYKRLAGVDMWGGSGAVWEVCLTPVRRSSEAQADEKSFHQTIIRIAARDGPFENRNGAVAVNRENFQAMAGERDYLECFRRESRITGEKSHYNSLTWPSRKF